MTQAWSPESGARDARSEASTAEEWWVEMQGTRHVVDRVHSIQSETVARMSSTETVEAYLCLAAAHQLVHMAYDFVWTNVRVLIALGASDGSARAIRWALSRWRPSWVAFMGQSLGEGVAAGARSTARAAVVSLAVVSCAIAVQLHLTRLLRPLYEAWVSYYAVSLVAAAWYHPDLLASMAEEVQERAQIGDNVLAVQVRAGRGPVSAPHASPCLLCDCSSFDAVGPWDSVPVRCPHGLRADRPLHCHGPRLREPRRCGPEGQERGGQVRVARHVNVSGIGRRLVPWPVANGPLPRLSAGPCMSWPRAWTSSAAGTRRRGS